MALIPWTQKEGMWVKTPLNQLKDLVGLSSEDSFLFKDDLKKATGMSDEAFEKEWEKLKEEGIARQILVKIVDGEIIDFCDPKEPRLVKS